ncbi:hypothetical protein [Paenibacillus graminis]|nr:hypothetical protein [Paenibacillus graminis]MEC0170663.1 hypothetical protein [Paenibacillus graminis]
MRGINTLDLTRSERLRGNDEFPLLALGIAIGFKGVVLQVTLD